LWRYPMKIPQEPSGILCPNRGSFSSLPSVRVGVVEPEYRPDQAVETVRFNISIGLGHNEGETLQYLLEEMLANMVSRIAIDPAHGLYPGLQTLEPRFRKRWLVEIQQDHTAMPELQALMGPLAEEFEVEMYPNGTIGADSEVFEKLPEGLSSSL